MKCPISQANLLEIIMIKNEYLLTANLLYFMCCVYGDFIIFNELINKILIFQFPRNSIEEALFFANLSAISEIRKYFSHKDL